MSWERDYYKAICDVCGYEGTCTVAIDDWNRSKTEWPGFEHIVPDPTAVGRKRTGSRDMRPKCPVCGGTSITRGDRIDSD